jgi:hypothetical protein
MIKRVELVGFLHHLNLGPTYSLDFNFRAVLASDKPIMVDF